MSEKILHALLQLFAIIAPGDEPDGEQRVPGREILERFLKRQFSPEQVAGHLAQFDAFAEAFHATGGADKRRRKRTSLNSVRVLRICTHVNAELTQHQKYVVLVYLLEFIHAGGHVGAQENDFVSTVGETFNIDRTDFERCSSFADRLSGGRVDNEHMLYIDGSDGSGLQKARHIHAHGLDGELRVLHVPGPNLHVIRYNGREEVTINGQRMHRDRPYVLGNGSSVRPPDGRPIYYSDIIGSFQQKQDRPRSIFKAEGIEYAFPNGRVGLHELHLAERSGRLIGIMGGSGSGKSTLLNVLNGNLLPCRGRVTINGIDVHRERKRIRGVIGHVSQDDLLIEELTVHQNLFYNAKLCFGDLNDDEVDERVLQMLQTLGLYGTKDLKVGSPLEKTISGGQRKRLNIALELIREPSVLFVDEPTSGLSSRDSENIMDLLKQLALKGRLIFVVIHQPSSDIFKLFDRLLLMDQEGHPVYYGDPVDAVVYFKRVTGQVDSEVGQCRACGNVNPEQIFNILESKLVDEYGNETDQRRISPEAWNEVFRAQMEERVAGMEPAGELPTSTFAAPRWLRQVEVFFKRDIRSKLANQQYVLVNLLEAPVLAFFMSFFLKYYRSDEATAVGYVFRQNENLPQYLFIAVIVSLFLGLTVSAEEIVRDRRILQREKFLDLSWGGYLVSKVGILFLISAIQTLLFVLVGSTVLGIEGMTLVHWALLFSTSCFANVLGLNVSATFNSAKVIYIVIPMLLIPQLLFSGIIVRFDRLHPTFASQRSVPWIGNVMASRWAYEGLAVAQFMGNAYERNFYELDRRMKSANWKKDLWVRELQYGIADVRRALENGEDLSGHEAELDIIRNELVRETRELQGFDIEGLDRLLPERVDLALLDRAGAGLTVLTGHYRNVYKEAEKEKEQHIEAMTRTTEGRKTYFTLLDGHRNESLADIVTNKNDVNVIVRYDGRLVRKSDPIYLVPERASLMEAHFYAPYKWVMGIRVSTFWANLLVLWAMSAFMGLALRVELFPRIGRSLKRA